MRQARLGDEVADTRGKGAQCGLVGAERAGPVGTAFHARLHARDQHMILGVDQPVDAPVQIARRAHRARLAGQRVAGIAQHGQRRRNRQPLHEGDLIGIEFERGVRPQLEVKPQALFVFWQMRRARQEVLVGAFGNIGRGTIREHARHPVHMRRRFDRIAAAEQARKARVADRNVQRIRIIVPHILPVDLACPLHQRADRAHILQPVGRDFCLVGRHHRSHRRAAALQPHEQEAAPLLHLDGQQAVGGGIEAGIVGALGDAGQAAVGLVDPRVVRADELARAATRPVDDSRAAMAAHIVKRAHHAVRAADDDRALADPVERSPVSGRRDIAFMTDDLPRGPHRACHLDRVIFGIVIEPTGQVHVAQRVGPLDPVCCACHVFSLASRRD